MRADTRFQRYSEAEWQAISAEVVRVLPSADLPRLRAKLEELGRNYVSGPAAPDLDRIKFLDAKEAQIAKFRKQVVEQGQLPGNLRSRISEALAEIERHYQDQALEIYSECRAANVPLQNKSIAAGPGYLRVRYTIPRSYNARLERADRYFEALLDLWAESDNNWWGSSNVKEIRAFIAACAKPVMRPESTSSRAIADRLYRLDRRRRAARRAALG
jgi:hypothetical protein